MTNAQRANVALLHKPGMSEYLEPCEDYEEAIVVYGFMRDSFPLNKVVIYTPFTHGVWTVGVVKV